MAKACVGYCRNRTLAGEDLFLLDPTFNINFTGATQCNQLLLVTLNNGKIKLYIDIFIYKPITIIYTRCY